MPYEGQEEGEEDENTVSEEGALEAELAWLTKEISKVYREHNPQKLCDILKQLETKYLGQEARI